MARHYSDHFHATGVVTSLAGTLPLDNSVKIDQGRGGAPLMVKRAYVNIGTAAVANDEIRMMALSSSCRIYDVRVISDGGATAFIADLGLYKAGANHDGAVIDADLFASALVLDAAIARVDEFLESAVLTAKDRGKYLWQLADIGAATYTRDPVEQWELAFTVTTTATVAVTDVIVEVIYTEAY